MLTSGAPASCTFDSRARGTDQAGPGGAGAAPLLQAAPAAQGAAYRLITIGTAGGCGLVDDHIDVDKVGTGRQTGIPASWEGAGSAEVEVDRGPER